MCRKEIFAGIIEEVAHAAETTPSVILSRCRTEEAVDARCAFVRIASEQGYYPHADSRLYGTHRRFRPLSADRLGVPGADVQAIRKHPENSTQTARKQLICRQLSIG